MRLLLRSTAALLLGLWCPGSTSAQQCDGSLTLAAGAARSLPLMDGIEGVVSGEDYAVLWSADGHLYTLTATGALTDRPLPDSLRLAGVGITAAGLRLLERSGREYLLDQGGRLRTLRPVPLGAGERLDQAHWDGSRWLLAIRSGRTGRFLLREAGGWLGGRVRYQSAAVDSLKDIPRYQVSGAGRQLLLTHVTAPFETIRIDPAGWTVDTFARPSAAELAIPRDSLSGWRALPAVALDCAVLVTLADLTSDRRVLVRYGADGRVVKLTALDAPFGLMTGLPHRPQLLAARRTGALELVWYEWRWTREPGASH